MTEIQSTTILPSTPNEKRAFSGVSMSSNKNLNGNGHFPQKLKNFFRMNGLGNNAEKTGRSEKGDVSPKSESKLSIRSSRFFPGRNRSVTVASEGNMLDETASPTAHANPYFAHQGLPALRHHNDGSVPPSPPDTPAVNVEGVSGANDQATTAGKEELARKLRRVASAPNAQGLFAKGNGGSDSRPATAELGKESPSKNGSSEFPKLMDSPTKGSSSNLTVPTADGSQPLQPPNIRAAAGFRRTYSSNSIKVRDVEVGPSSFDKIKLIGKGDVGKVYLVREKKSSRLYAMKGNAALQLHKLSTNFT
jgi:protein-serine/threonine kinase